MMIKQKPILIFFIAYFSLFNSQNINPNALFPINAEMSGLVKRVDIPINYSSGALNYSLNLYTLKLKNLDIPINLSYTSTGFKPSENSSNIGLGWDLEIGGKISRSIQGLDDFVPNRETAYFPNGFPVDKPLRMGFAEFINNMQGAYAYPEYQFLRENSNSRLELMGEFVSQWGINADSEPDIFYYSFPGKTGKFFLDTNMQGRQMPFGKEIIIKDNSGFTIKDTTGNIYEYSVFDDVEINSGSQIVSGSYPVGGKTSYYTSTFFLSKILSKGDIVEFLYDNVEYGYSNPTSYMKGISSDGYYLPSGYSTEFEIKNTSKVSKHTLPILKKILVNSKEKILFNYSSEPRNDVDNNFSKKISALSNIIVKDEGSAITVGFNHSYFKSEISGSENSNNSWLKLDSILVNDKKYKFEYYEGSLPTKDTEIKDFWGYNTTSSNNGLKRYNEKNFRMYFYTGNKVPNKEASELTVLKKIIYPTKGEDNFVLENNTYNEAAYNDFNCSDRIVGLYSSDELSVNGVFDQQIPFTLSEPHTIKLKYDIQLPFNGQNTQYISCSLKKTDENIEIALPGMSGVGNKELSLNAGTYSLSMITSGLPDPYIQLSWDECSSNFVGQKNLEVGGLRLSRVTSKDFNGQIVLNKKISYNENNISTGKLYDYPLFYDLETIHWITGDPNFFFMCPLERQKIYKKYYSNSISDVSGYNGNPVFYKRVEETMIDKNNENIGKTVYTFLNYNDQPLYYNNYYLTFNDNSWKRGLLESQEIYKKNELSPTKIIINNYKILETPQIDASESGLGFTPPSFPNEYHRMSYKFFIASPEYALFLPGNRICINLAGFDYVGKKLISAQVFKEQEITKENFNGKTVVTTVDYKYDNPSHAQLTSQTITFPDKSISETSYQYAHEKGKMDMIVANMVAIPLETTVVKKQDNLAIGKMISKSGLDYKKRTIDGKILILPNIAYSYDLQNPSDSLTQLKYKEYDDKGNILQFNLKTDSIGNGGTPTAIIWGYNQTQPIAKIEGATYAQVSSLAQAIITASNTDASQAPNNDETAFLLLLDTFRKNLTNYQVTTYTYDPLIGVRSITPPSGIREIYTYDSANRLQSVKDVDGKILKEYKYNYKP